MCKSIHRLFGIEKVAKDFRGSNAAAKAWLRGGFRAPKPFAPPKSQKPFFALSTKLCCEIAARPARGYGVLYEVEYFRHKCYFLYSHAVDRTHFFDQLAYGKMTLLNYSFMFGLCGVKF